MSDDIDRELKEFRARFPRPRDQVTRRVERQLRARLKTQRRRLRSRSIQSATAVLAVLALGAAFGAGVIAMAAGAATDRVTLTVRPTIVLGTEYGSATAFGAVSSGRIGEHVQLERRECRQSAFRVDSGPAFVGETSTDGTYGGEAWFTVNTSVRARWKEKDIVSEVVEVKRRPTVQLRQRFGGRFELVVWAVGYFEGKRARIDRWNGQRWIVLRRVTLKRGIAGIGEGVVGSEAEARMRVGKGTRLRAVLPGDQARPCYIEGVSRIIAAR